MSWKPEVKVGGKWYPNGLVFATEQEAKDNAFDKSMAWTQAEDSRAVESDLPPNYTYENGELTALPGA
jgi:hypothetical protein